ncbi:spore coat protein [Gracilibacillus caseinilyticus]|uniref:Spore coat protein n=1 Tax=Gracilibacillus caseinilyticus TaxID=2932256 RepID=A0ABY4EUX3_9BACI|nr:spore coat protein [Gracilibacillus caseinilyticus]UOQ47612.1 spore coat protein [Gracilibacillus caseinilyticus]
MRHRRPFGCVSPANTIVHPTKCKEVHTCSESEVNHIHPTHTNVVNHHLVKNTHYYPQTTSYQNTVDQVNTVGNPNAVMGAMDPGMGNGMGNGMNNGMVGGAVDPGFNQPPAGHCCKPKKMW